ncbi:MAG: carboxypeptidase-like regulatory domain-containing protein, partial [Chitinophagaceae bacterium]|nr:carboxypeptidase-like regulatory domain-containing protein [Chitinophagaceae bacterium]
MANLYLRLIVFFSLLGLQSNAQQLLVQTIKGSVADRFIKNPLAGATIEWIGAERKLAISDGKGNFTLSSIPVGRQSIKISHVGYKPITLNNLQVESGKELVLVVEMEDDLSLENEIIVKAKSNKGRPINEMAMV